MKVLVTGAAGFVGFHTAQRLLKEGHEVTGYDNLNDYYDPMLKKARLDILNRYRNFDFVYGDIWNAEEDLRWDYTHVVHLAAQAGVRHSLKDPYCYLRSNVAGFFEIMETARKNGCSNFVYASSSSVYGGNAPPFSSSASLSSPLSLYAATKIAGEALAKSHGHIHEMNNTGFRFFTVYGPWGRPDMFMWIAAEKIMKGESVPLFGSSNYRDFTYIDDIVDGLMLALQKPQKNKVYNLGCGRSTAITDVLSWIKEDLGFDPDTVKIDVLEEQPGDVSRTLSDTSDTERDLGWKAKTAPRDGVRKFCEWFKQRNRL